MGVVVNISPQHQLTRDFKEAALQTANVVDEKSSDGQFVHFIISSNNNEYKIRANKKAILENSIELSRIINYSSMARKNNNIFAINNVDKQNFELLISFFETKSIKFIDHTHIIQMLQISNRFNCPDLIITCVKEIDLILSNFNVLDIFRALWYYNFNQKNDFNISTASTPEEYLSALHNNLLEFIDVHAEIVLKRAEILDFRFEELEMIVKRDTLQLKSETTLFSCLADWSIEECKRKNLDITAENRRQVLGPLCYSIHYLLLSREDLNRILNHVELLDSAEISLIKKAIEGKEILNLTLEQKRMLDHFKSERPDLNSTKFLSNNKYSKGCPQSKIQKIKKGLCSGNSFCLKVLICFGMVIFTALVISGILLFLEIYISRNFDVAEDEKSNILLNRYNIFLNIF